MALELLQFLNNVFTGSPPAADDEDAPYEKQEASTPPQQAASTVVINGIAMPQRVVDQLRQHGFNPEWCTRYELAAAEQEALVDGTVFHDADGVDFYDDLELTEEEIEEDDDKIDSPAYRMNLHVKPDEDHEPEREKAYPVMSFREMEKRRRREKTNHANDEGGHDVESM